MAGLIEVVVGVIGRPNGIRGDVTIDVRTDEPERRFVVGAALRAEGTRRLLTVTSTRWHSGRLIASFAELPDRNAVEDARGLVLVADVPDDETPTGPDEYYDRQLVGLAVVRADGTPAGRITSVLHGAAQDLLVVDTESGERLIPFVSELVPTVDLASGSVTLADVGGLLDDEDAGVTR